MRARYPAIEINGATPRKHTLRTSLIILSRLFFYAACGIGLFLIVQICIGERSNAASWIKVLPNGGYLVVEHDSAGLTVGYSPSVADSRAAPPEIYEQSRLFTNSPSSPGETGQYVNLTFNPTGKLMLEPVRLYHFPVYLPYITSIAVGSAIIFLAAFDILRLNSRYQRYKRGMRGLCPNCGYDLVASFACCPECGQPLNRLRIRRIRFARGE